MLHNPLEGYGGFGPANNSFINDVRLVWISLEGLPIYAWNKNALAKMVSAWGTISDVDATEDASLPFKKLKVWSPEFDDEACISSSFDEESVDGENHDSMDETSVDEEKALELDLPCDDPTYPPGFTPIDASDKVEEDVANSVNQLDTKIQSCSNGMSNVKSGVNRSFTLNSGGSIMDVIENLVDIGQTMGYNMEGCLGQVTKKRWIKELNQKNRIKFIVIQETKLDNIDLFSIKELWGNFSFEFAINPSVGFSGGILCVWDPNIFAKDNVTISDSFMAVRGTWVPSSTKLLIVSVYAPQDLSGKKSLWDYISHMIDMWNRECIILGDFNEVRTKQERFGLLSVYPSLSALCLATNLSDHRPIILREAVVDYGPSPFHVYHSLFDKDGFEKLVDDSWKNFNSKDSCKITLSRRKFHSLKASIKEWCKEDNQRTNEHRFSIQSRISDIDKMFDNRISNEDLLNEWTSLRKDLHDINMRHSLDLAQKAKIRWSIEGDENSKFFHGIINKKRSHLAIRGVLVEGDWIDDPVKVKNEFLNHFSNCFSMPSGPIELDPSMFKQLSLEQNIDLECDDTTDEIKRAVWDCGTNKSSKPDGKFPPGSNSLFITLIPKKQDVNLVKDFRSISLISSFYKIIARILANLLNMVISDFVDFEKAFDSVRWDYLDGILSNFVFGTKWRGWIQGCLTSTMGSILINGIPTSEFKFHKGLFKGLRINEILTLSHLFYADDAVFIGISHEEVKVAAKIISCATFTMPFTYLGVKVGISSSRRKYLSQGMSLWSRLVSAIHGVKLSFEPTGYSNSSSPWNNIIREVGSLSSQGVNFLSLLKKKVGNRVNTSFWDDTWLNDTPLRQLFPWLYTLENRKQITVADKLKDTSLSGSFRRYPRGGFPTRWVKVVPIKINIFAWKVSLDKLPSRFNLSLHGIDIPSIMCPICNLAGESSSYLLFSCSMACFLWRKVARWWDLNIQDFSSNEDWIAWFNSIRISKELKDVLKGVCYVLWWVIWKFRNQLLSDYLLLCVLIVVKTI
ncbi:RNA-directed DNA polymerase, eukaryota [Tanacetum coccineum]